MSRGKIAGILIAVALVGLIGWRAFSGSSTGNRRGPGGDPNAPVAVTAVAVATEDVPLTLDALGTVQALNTVTVRPQVGGQIDSIAFREGQEIKKGDVIAVIDPRTFQAQLDQATAKKKQDEALLGSAQSTLKRYEELMQKNFVAAQDLENQRHTVRQLQAQVGADDAAIANARVQLGYTTVRAPIDGLAGIRLVDEGNIVQSGQSAGIVVLTQVHPITVVFSLPEQHLALVRRSQDGGLAVKALDRTDNRVIAEGTLRVIDNQIDSTTGTFKLKAEFENADNALWPGQFVNVRLGVSDLKNALVVPQQALQRGPEGTYVYLVGDDDTVRMQPVKAGIEAPGGKVVIADGVSAGQRVVTEGQFRLKPGARVQALAPGEVRLPEASPATNDTNKAAPRRRRDG
ncbi:efflux RND transporter periplasmic adaptor subunit [Tahibacter amnicola]|uniref:Efflux RND transporter periplasmic adaptor subunit n=1 Tax=Tahibacter amnicola TaxID=2976241 RepID=A0ABY6BHW5_9GAMM|nr:efflux RND transporter periplasmic adaptor subunit [Tahibacter amnicola]UXI67452.1 efflux RND transporter periplasmic adaptor subunit [Tahibacter amnicola]